MRKKNKLELEDLRRLNDVSVSTKQRNYPLDRNFRELYILDKIVISVAVTPVLIYVNRILLLVVINNFIQPLVQTEASSFFHFRMIIMKTSPHKCTC